MGENMNIKEDMNKDVDEDVDEGCGTDEDVDDL